MAKAYKWRYGLVTEDPSFDVEQKSFYFEISGVDHDASLVSTGLPCIITVLQTMKTGALNGL